MKTVVLASTNNADLKPLSDKTCRALLPIGGKPVIEHAIESLYSAGIREITILLNAATEQVMEIVADGSRWDMRLQYELLSSDTPRRLATADGEIYGSGEVLLVPGDLLWSMDLREFLQHARETGEKQVCGVSSGKPVIMWTDGTEEIDDWQMFDLSTLPQNRGARLTLPNVNSLNSLAEYHQANIDLVNGKFPHLYPRGREHSNGLILDFGTRVNPGSLKSGMACIGRNCSIHRSVQFERDVVIGDSVLVDRGAKITNSVVLPDTYIGEMVTLKNAIVWGDTIIRIDSGVIMQLDDELLFADMGRSQKSDAPQKGKLSGNSVVGESLSSAG